MYTTAIEAGYIYLRLKIINKLDIFETISLTTEIFVYK